VGITDTFRVCARRREAQADLVRLALALVLPSKVICKYVIVSFGVCLYTKGLASKEIVRLHVF
jgi:hypothetical protein